MTVKLYRFVPKDRSGRVAWLLHEMEVAFEVVEVNAREGEHLEDEFLSISPGGTIPAVVDGEDVLFESGAALQHLADRYGEGEFAPLAGEPGRATYLSWLYFASASLDALCFAFVNPLLSEEFRASRVEYALRRVPRMLDAVERQFVDRQYLLSRGFTAVDIQLAGALDYADASGCLEGREELKRYLEAMRQRSSARAVEAFQ